MAYPFTQADLLKGMDYVTYRTLIDQLFAEGKTTGADQSEMMVNYSKMNVHRMERVEKTLSLIPSLTDLVTNIETPMVWIIITEAWCGDAAVNIPAIAGIAALNDQIEIRVFLRDEYPEIMNEYLTNGGKSIPVVIGLNKETMQQLFVWGPRPNKGQELVTKIKNTPGSTKEDMINELYKWYAKDHTQSLQEEFEALLTDI